MPLHVLDLAALAERVQQTNPFSVNRVDLRSAKAIDVADINRSHFERLVMLAQQACAEDRGVGTVLWGEAGTGKSHLFARLARWAGSGECACYVYLHNLLPDAEHLPRYILKTVIAALSRGRADRTPLFRTVNGAVRAALKHEAKASADWPGAEAAYFRHVRRLAAVGPGRASLFDPDVYRALFVYYRSTNHTRPEGSAPLAPLALRWLSGETLDPTEAHQIGLAARPGSDEGVRLADDQRIKHAFVALTQLAHCRQRPLVLCFDQVENLDPDRLTALTRFLHDLLDSCGNLLVVLGGVKLELVNFREANLIHAAAWERLTQYPLDLFRLRKNEVRAILEARLKQHFAPLGANSPATEPFRDDPLFPLGTAWYEGRFGNALDVIPRHAINEARERWEHQQARLAAEPPSEWLTSWERNGAVPVPPPPRTEAIDALVDERLRAWVERRLREPHTLPPSAENLAGLTRALLEQCLTQRAAYGLQALRRSNAKKKQRPPFDFALRRADGSDVGVLFVVTENANSATASLRRLLHSIDTDGPGRLFLITDERQPLHLGDAGQGYLEELTERAAPTFDSLVLTFAEYATLDALQGVVGEARSGDLEIVAVSGEEATVGADEVVASHHRRGRYRAQRLLGALLGTAAAPKQHDTARLHAAPSQSDDGMHWE